MGSSGSKPRKKKSGKQPQHLPKVGTATENQRLLHEEQHAVAAQMGLGGAGAGTQKLVMIVIGVILVITILSLLALITFH